jgi:FkbM family methyltransferase
LIHKLDLTVDGNPIFYRAGTDDLAIINSILIRQEFACVGEDVYDPKLIVDCGAYAGYSTLYFLSTYKNAHVVALEPDERNLELCRLNVQAYGARVSLIEGAIWPEPAKLALRKNRLAGMQREWATMVGVPQKGEPAPVLGVDFRTVLADSGLAEIDLVKLNVNGVEDELFSRHTESWMPLVRSILVRPLNEALESALLESLAAYRFFLSRGTGLFAFTRIGVKAAPVARPRADPGRNAVTNGSFEDLRVGPGRVAPGRWMCEPNDVADGWVIAVCDPQFRISLAVRTGLQRSGHTALHIALNSDVPVLPDSAPYAAIENSAALTVSEGEHWSIRACVKSTDDGEAVEGARGAYVFLRVFYEDGTFADLRTEPVFKATGEYAEIGGTVTIPASPGSPIVRASLWLYAWIENHGPERRSTDSYGGWKVLFDDVFCAKIREERMPDA